MANLSPFIGLAGLFIQTCECNKDMAKQGQLQSQSGSRPETRNWGQELAGKLDVSSHVLVANSTEGEA